MHMVEFRAIMFGLSLGNILSQVLLYFIIILYYIYIILLYIIINYYTLSRTQISSLSLESVFWLPVSYNFPLKSFNIWLKIILCFLIILTDIFGSFFGGRVHPIEVRLPGLLLIICYREGVYCFGSISPRWR